MRSTCLSWSLSCFSDKLTDSLNDITKMIDEHKTISDVQFGLKTGDVNRIKGHTGKLQNVKNALKSILPGV